MAALHLLLGIRPFPLSLDPTTMRGLLLLAASALLALGACCGATAARHPLHWRRPRRAAAAPGAARSICRDLQILLTRCW